MLCIAVLHYVVPPAVSQLMEMSHEGGFCFSTTKELQQNEERHLCHLSWRWSCWFTCSRVVVGAAGPPRAKPPC